MWIDTHGSIQASTWTFRDSQGNDDTHPSHKCSVCLGLWLWFSCFPGPVELCLKGAQPWSPHVPWRGSMRPGVLEVIGSVRGRLRVCTVELPDSVSSVSEGQGRKRDWTVLWEGHYLFPGRCGKAAVTFPEMRVSCVCACWCVHM